jgi:hypothetical protein
LNTDAYVSLANEKGMGVEEFLKLVGPEFKFKQFEKENHNSVGAPTYEWALQDIFKVWKNDKTYFDSAKELEEYENKNSSFYNIPLPVADGVLYNTIIYVLKDKPKELEKVKNIITNKYPNSAAYLTTLLATNNIKEHNYKEAKNIILESLNGHPESFELYEKLAEINLSQDNTEKFKEKIQKALSLAKKQGVRQWRIEEIKDIMEKLKN